MASTIKEIKDLIIAKIQGLQVNSEDAFDDVFGYSQANFENYPAAVIRSKGGRGVEIDTHRNERIFSFEILLYQEQSLQGKTPQEAESIMTATSDAVLLAFDRDKDLGRQVEIVKVIEFSSDFEVKPGTFNYATFKVDVMVIVQNY